MKERLERIKEEAIAQIQASDVPEKLNDVRVKFLEMCIRDRSYHCV